MGQTDFLKEKSRATERARAASLGQNTFLDLESQGKLHKDYQVFDQNMHMSTLMEDQDKLFGFEIDEKMAHQTKGRHTEQQKSIKIKQDPTHQQAKDAQLKTPPTEIKKTLKRVSAKVVDNNPAITVVENVDLMAQIREAFNIFDLDKNGLISRSELKKALTNLGIERSDVEVEEMIRLADLNQDNHIDYEEFVSMIIEAKSD